MPLTRAVTLTIEPSWRNARGARPTSESVTDGCDNRTDQSPADAAIGYEHAIVAQLRERGWPVAVAIPSAAGAWWLLMTVAAIPCSCGLPGALATRSGRGSHGSLAD